MKFSPSIKKRVTKGFGLLEVILVFAIVIGAAAVVFTVFQSAKPSADASNEASNLTTLATNLKSTYGINHDFSGVSNANAILAKAVPAPMVSGTNIVSQWGAVTVAPVAADKTEYTITYAGVPTDTCAKFVSGVAGFFPTAIGTTAGGTDIMANGVFASGQPVTACAGASAATTVTVSFTGK